MTNTSIIARAANLAGQCAFALVSGRVTQQMGGGISQPAASVCNTSLISRLSVTSFLGVGDCLAVMLGRGLLAMKIFGINPEDHAKKINFVMRMYPKMVVALQALQALFFFKFLILG